MLYQYVFHFLFSVKEICLKRHLFLQIEALVKIHMAMNLLLSEYKRANLSKLSDLLSEYNIELLWAQLYRSNQFRVRMNCL